MFIRVKDSSSAVTSASEVCRVSRKVIILSLSPYVLHRVCIANRSCVLNAFPASFCCRHVKARPGAASGQLPWYLPSMGDFPPIISHSSVKFVSIQPSSGTFCVSELSQFGQRGYNRGAGPDFTAKEGGGELLLSTEEHGKARRTPFFVRGGRGGARRTAFSAKGHEEHLLSGENCLFPRKSLC